MFLYSPVHEPDYRVWLACPEQDRLDSVIAYHQRLGLSDMEVRRHSLIHVVVENQLAEEVAAVAAKLDELMAGGLDRHEAIHAIGSVVMELIYRTMGRHDIKPDAAIDYDNALSALTVASWRNQIH